MTKVTRSELEVLLARFPDRRIGVIGDLALDVYWMVDAAAATPSVETGKLTRPVAVQRCAPGAAANVVVDLVALGCGRVFAFGVVGRDPWGTELLRILRERGVEVGGMVEQAADWSTVTYVKPHVAGMEQRRFDFGDFNRIHDDTADRVADRLEAALPELDAVVINAQARSGIHGEQLRRRLAGLIASRPEKVFIVDSRHPRTMYPGCVLKINDLEAARYFGLAGPRAAEISRERSLEAAGELFAARGRPVFVTRGREGMLVHDAAGVAELPGIDLGDEVDTTGAGDAALAGIAAALACGAASRTAACVGNLAAAVCAGKLHQTGSASPEEVLSLFRRNVACRSAYC